MMSNIIRNKGILGRKIALNIALSSNTIIDESTMVRNFDPAIYMVKITPMHLTRSCVKNGLKTENGYSRFTPYADLESRLKGVGYDVIVFVPSIEEDDGLITCGNAILSGSMPRTEYKEG